MGIPAFYGIFIRALNERSERKFILSREDIDTRVEVLNVDMNSLLHQAAQIAFGYAQGAEYWSEVRTTSSNRVKIRFKEQIQTELRLLYETYRPRVIYIAIDGSAPLAKLKQQRERRYRSLLESEKDDNPFSAQGLTGFLLTPGSFLMEWITLHLEEFIEEMDLEDVEIILDGSNNPGEGEQKFMNSIIGRDIMDLGIDSDTVSVVTYGADADLIVMMLASLGGGYIDRGVEDMDVIDIRVLSEVISELYPLYDFLFMVMLLGNDFVPPLPMMEDIRTNFPRVLEVYQEIRISDPGFRLIHVGAENDFDVDLDGTRGIVNRCNLYSLQTLFQTISELEHGAMIRMSRSLMRSDPILRGFNHRVSTIHMRDTWYNRIGDQEEVNMKYIEGLMWAFRYLTTGSLIYTDEGSYPALDMSYVYPYSYAPLALGLTHIAHSDPPEYLFKKNGDGPVFMSPESRGLEVSNPFTSTLVSFPRTLGRDRVITPIFRWIYELPSVLKWSSTVMPSSFTSDTLTVLRRYTSKIDIPEIPEAFIEAFQREFLEEIQRRPEDLKYYDRIYAPGLVLISPQ